MLFLLHNNINIITKNCIEKMLGWHVSMVALVILSERNYFRA